MVSSNRNYFQTAFVVGLVVLVFATTEMVHAQLSRNQARNLIRRAAGFELTGGAVKVNTVTNTSASSADVNADVRGVFHFQKDEKGNWHIAAFRTGQDRWERIEVIDRAVGYIPVVDECNVPDPPLRGSLATDPAPRRVRCLLGSRLGIRVPSDAIRIQEVAPLAVPFASQPSATVVAWIRLDARAIRDQKAWRITEVRRGNGDWVNLESVVAAVNQHKNLKARAELETIAKALEKYRIDRGYYVVSDSQPVLIDHLSPKYLLPVLRVDPWNVPYQYEGTRERFTISSAGPDKRPKTPDDISISGSPVSPGS